MESKLSIEIKDRIKEGICQDYSHGIGGQPPLPLDLPRRIKGERGLFFR